MKPIVQKIGALGMGDSVWFDARVAENYEAWYETEGRRADGLEKRLLAEFLRAFPGANSLLEIGCGTGHFTRWFGRHEVRVIGLDISPTMLGHAHGFGNGQYVRADALSLPFEDGAFDLTALITVLEFSSEPERMMAEALRVTRRGLILGVLNRWSALGLWRRLSGAEIWKQARFFSAKELRHLICGAAPERLRDLRMRTTLFPPGLGFAAPFLPLGGFIGAGVFLDEPDISLPAVT